MYDEEFVFLSKEVKSSIESKLPKIIDEVWMTEDQLGDEWDYPTRKMMETPS